MQSIKWLILFVVLIGVEAATMGLFTIWFAGGSLAAFVVALFEGGWLTQVIVFLAVSFVLLIFTRPVAVRYYNNKRAKTNIESVVGEEVRVTEEINNFQETGAVILNGLTWTARSCKDEDVIPVGEKVTVRKVNGVKLLVEPVAAPKNDNA
ncbi:MAG: NfeD family protein [Lachnospiraceae bacterium]|nr:NfeD family protein [Lachnospiraceae bacterium]